MDTMDFAIYKIEVIDKLIDFVHLCFGLFLWQTVCIIVFSVGWFTCFKPDWSKAK